MTYEDREKLIKFAEGLGIQVKFIPYGPHSPSDDPICITSNFWEALGHLIFCSQTEIAEAVIMEGKKYEKI